MLCLELGRLAADRRGDGVGGRLSLRDKAFGLRRLRDGVRVRTRWLPEC